MWPTVHICLRTHALCCTTDAFLGTLYFAGYPETMSITALNSNKSKST